MMKKIWNSFKIAFSMYSKLPMPKSEWNRENLSHALIYFPWIGGLIGAGVYGIFRLKEWCLLQEAGVSEITFTVLMVIAPVLITGGIHMDGFMDTQDALSSYQTKERRLEILKDPHAGAFAILSCAVYFLCCMGIYASLTDRSVRAAAMGFLLSRTLSGLSVVTFPQAKKDGLAATFAENAAKKTVKIVLSCYLAVLLAAMAVIGKGPGIAAMAAAVLSFFHYYRMSVKNFGGITGDLAGYFLQMCEIWMAAAAVGADIVIRNLL